MQLAKIAKPYQNTLNLFSVAFADMRKAGVPMAGNFHHLGALNPWIQKSFLFKMISVKDKFQAQILGAEIYLNKTCITLIALIPMSFISFNRIVPDKSLASTKPAQEGQFGGDAFHFEAFNFNR